MSTTNTTTAATVYSTTGSVRGNCGHKHTTMSGAIRCLLSDRRGCRSVGGYSDRVLRVRDSGEWRAVEDNDMSASDVHLLYGDR